MKRLGQAIPGGPPAENGRLLARPAATGVLDGKTGLHALGLSKDRDAQVYIPSSYRAESPAPIAVMLHGAGGAATGGLGLLSPLADDAGLIVLAPSSLGRTWDFLLKDYGPDVDALDQALRSVFAQYAIDPARVAVGGFSDGASYALSLGLTNGDLFTHVIAFSPGLSAPVMHRGKPRLFVAHGIHDSILRIESCSRRIVPRLKMTGYDIEYHEFDGPHTVPTEMVRTAMEWLMR